MYIKAVSMEGLLGFIKNIKSSFCASVVMNNHDYNQYPSTLESFKIWAKFGIRSLVLSVLDIEN